jgi:3-isopropylmalate dehydrogenase
MPAPRTYRIVVIRGDGIGPELVDAALRVLAALEKCHGGFRLEIEEREGGADLYRRSGANLAPGTLEAIQRAAADLVRGAVYASLESGRLVIGRSDQPEGGTRRAAETIAATLGELAHA